MSEPVTVVKILKLINQRVCTWRPQTILTSSLIIKFTLEFDLRSVIFTKEAAMTSASDLRVTVFE